MDESTIKAARALCDAATPGEWHCYHHEGYGWRVDAEKIGIVHGDWNEADGDFIAAARTLLPAALDSLETTRRERDEALADGVLSQRVCDIENDLAQARSDLAATKAALAEAMAMLEEAHYYRDDSKDFAAQVAALKAKVQP